MLHKKFYLTRESSTFDASGLAIHKLIQNMNTKVLYIYTMNNRKIKTTTTFKIKVNKISLL